MANVYAPAAGYGALPITTAREFPMTRERSGPRPAKKPLLLDLFCGAGGAAMGYHRAGFDIVGVDLAPQPRYPFKFINADALDFMDELFGSGNADFAAIHASPPCQDYSRAMRHLSAPQPRLIEPVRDALVAIGLPWVIENVVGAPIPVQNTLDGRYGVELCGTMFGLRVYRHRLFEASFPIEPPRPCGHLRPAMNPHQQEGRNRIYAEFGRSDPEVIWRAEMGVEWMERYEGREAIPPAYTEHVGHFLMREVNAQASRHG